METLPLIQVSGLHKKFTTDIRRNMQHGLMDLSRSLIGKGKFGAKLRKGEFYGLRDINLRLMPNEILAIAGLNGSGKTTLMRLISGIYQPDSGTIIGREGLKITAIFALSAGMQPLFTGRENIYIKGAMYGMSQEEVDEQIPFIESFSELGELLDRPFGNYSSGMRARLSYSIAMATRPDIFIIDESLAVGDSAFKAKCFDNLRDFAKQPGKGVLFVSNHLRKIMKIGQRLIVMEKGEIIHETADVRAGLEFYVRNCYRGFPEEIKNQKIATVLNYEL